MKLSANQEIGRAAEHLVTADLILQNVPALIVNAPWPYDVLGEVDGRLVRVQVKATLRARSWEHARDVYRFSLRCGVGSERAVVPESVDAIALVALDVRRIAYFAVGDLMSSDGTLRQTVDLRDGDTYQGRQYSTGKIRSLTWHQTFGGKSDLRAALNAHARRRA